MNEQARNSLDPVDALVQAYLAKQADEVDGAAGLARVQAALRSTPPVSPIRSRRGLRWAIGVGMAATVVMAFFSGWYLNPAQANARELIEEVKRIHNQPLARCYLVSIQRIANDDDVPVPEGKLARHVRIWTRGDRFWVEMQHGESLTPFIWGRGENGTLWAVLDSHRGVRVPLDQAPKPLQRVADLYTLNVDTLLAEVLADCTLMDSVAEGTKLTRAVVAEPRLERTRLWLSQATLEVDSETKVLRRLVILRNLLGIPQARVTFTLVETRPDDDAKYRLEGHLTEPIRIHEGNFEPRVKLELLGRWFGVRKEARGAKEDGRAKTPSFTDVAGHEQMPLSQPDKKATVLFFVMSDCPISNAYAPEIQRICSAYESKLVAGFVVHADPDATADDVKKHAKAYGFTCPVLLDPTHRIVKKAGVSIAPEVAVLGPNGKVLYRGRIDDWYVDYGKRRGEPTQRDLRNALDSILEDRAIATPTTKAIGCPLPEPRN